MHQQPTTTPKERKMYTMTRPTRTLRAAASGTLRGTGTSRARFATRRALRAMAHPRSSTAFTTIVRYPVARDRHGYTLAGARVHRRSHAMLLEVLAYGRGEDDGLVTVRVVLAGRPEEPRTVQVLAEDIFISDSPLRASHAAGVWAAWKYDGVTP